MFAALLKAFLAVVYFIFIVPIGFITRLISDPLSIRRKGGASNWVARPAKRNSLEDARRLI